VAGSRLSTQATGIARTGSGAGTAGAGAILTTSSTWFGAGRAGTACSAMHKERKTRFGVPAQQPYPS